MYRGYSGLWGCGAKTGELNGKQYENKMDAGCTYWGVIGMIANIMVIDSLNPKPIV